MRRIGQITYEYTEEEYKELNENIEEIDSFLKGYADQERAEVAIHNLKRIVTGEGDD